MAERRITKADFAHVAEFICEELRKRKSRRKDLEKNWDEIDRQIRMEPSLKHKSLPNGKADPKRVWMSEMELPLQAQTLEVLTADVREAMFADNDPWFRARSALTDEYLERVDFQSLILGDEAEVPSQINQDNADRLVEGFLMTQFSQYDFMAHYDLINAEAFKYGTGIGRARMATKQVFLTTAKGTVRKDKRIPVLFPRSIRRTYLDDSPHNIMNEGQIVGPAVIATWRQSVKDIQLAANKGSTDPDNMDGGWMPQNTKNLDGDDRGMVDVIEFEGDLVIPRKTVRSVHVPNVIVTVIEGDNAGRAVVRLRFRDKPYSSYIVHPYHMEDVDSAYATSPLMKGRPIQIAAVSALNRLMDAAALKNAPPVGYDRSDLQFASEGGPVIHPYAQWGTNDSLTVHDKVGGDPAAMSNVYLALLDQYATVTGMTGARFGRQTISHTTAFAKDVELQRGSSRTVDYVKASGLGPLTQWLYMAYDMGRDSMKGTEQIYLQPYNGWVEIDKDMLPDKVFFEWFGSGGPAERQAQQQSRLGAAQLAIQLDQLQAQLGGQPTLNIPALIQQALRDGGWTDTDTIIQQNTQAQAPQATDVLTAALEGAQPQ